MKMFYAAYKDGKGETHGNLYTDAERYFSDTFDPYTVIICVIPFDVKGKTYAERKDYTRKLAIDFQLYNEPGLSYGELWEIEHFFLENARRYGLLREFRENAVI